MDKVEWHRVAAGCLAGFTLPCQGDYSWGNGEGARVIDICPNPETEKHGHVHILTTSGKVRLPICCYSQEGVFKAFSFYSNLLDYDFLRARNFILDQLQVRQLPLELTQAEKEFYESPEAMEKMYSLMFVTVKKP